MNCIRAAWNRVLLGFGIATAVAGVVAWSCGHVEAAGLEGVLVGSAILTGAGVVGSAMRSRDRSRRQYLSLTTLQSMTIGDPEYRKALLCFEVEGGGRHGGRDPKRHLFELFDNIAKAIREGAIDEDVAKALLERDLTIVFPRFEAGVDGADDLESIRWLSNRWGIQPTVNAR